MKRSWFTAGVAVLCLLAGSTADASATTQRLTAMSGDIDPMYGPINPFYGKINPFYGQISPFWGDITPFWGQISPFWGDIQPFYGNIHPFWGNISPFRGNINPFWGTIQPFWEDMGPVWGGIDATWAALQESEGADYSGLQAQLQQFVSDTEAFWGARVEDKTGDNFMDGFASELLARYGIDLSDPSSLAGVSAEDRAWFFLNWYDGLMDFSGADHVDWWMPAVHWSPMLTQIAKGGTANENIVVGLIDSTPSRLDPSIQHLKIVGGSRNYTNPHGAAVGSLISAQHDRQGIMGIAPDARVYLYNPFDATGTADFDSVEAGINTLYSKGAHVVNLSLGVPGSVLTSDWKDVFEGLLMNPSNILFVKAAGNEGITQNQNVAWGLLNVPNNLIIVGSVGPSGEISQFSNRPGEACFTIVLGLLCSEQNKLKYRFIVAPGELMLVSDNNGGVTRMSGTSFAAPLVTGAVALLYTRWPWLQEHSAETAQIIFQSADDLGAPGVDPVYGWGMLNVEASQSPLDWDDLVVYHPASYVKGENYTTLLNLPWSASALKTAVLDPGQLDLWENDKAYIVAFENIGLTQRDFVIPLSSALVNKSQRVNSQQGGRFQTYLYQRMIDWANGTGFSDFAGQTARLGAGEWNFSMMATEAPSAEVANGAQLPFHSEFVAENPRAGIALRFGEGSGAYAFSSHRAFAMRSDFDPATGGVNPILGFASGDAYAQGEYTIGERIRVSVGVSQRSDDHTFTDPMRGEVRYLPLAPYQASASVATIEYAVDSDVRLNVSYTRLVEANGLLGAQGSGALGFGGGSRTDAATMGATASLDFGIEVMGSFTFGETPEIRFENSPLGISDGGLRSTAWQLAAMKTGVFSNVDRLRVSLTQPLQVESGALEYRSLQVVDRSTGELGLLTQRWNIAGEREYRAEAIYAVPVMDGRAEVSGFALLELNPRAYLGEGQAVSLGARFRIDL